MYRDCVEEITELLKKQRPLIRPMKFVGQASASKTAKGISQKEQLRVVKQFKEGGYNTLISTSVGEEGLDIGEVDLIICYDATSSPVRSVQRMGRTGRKRCGKIVVLVTEGKEQQMFNSSECNKKRVHKAILGNKKFDLYRHNRRMIPNDITPDCAPMFTTQLKPYENCVGKKKLENSPQTSGLSKFVGTLTSAQFVEWERDFKLSVKAATLLPRSKFIVCKESVDLNPLNEITLNKYSAWQDRMQLSSANIKPTSFRSGFVNLMKLCQKLTYDESSLMEYDLTAKKCSNSIGIEKFCVGNLATKDRTVSAKNASITASRKRSGPPMSNLPPKSRRSATLFSGTGSSSFIASEYSTTDLHVMASGEKLQLNDIFPVVKNISRENTTELVKLTPSSDLPGSLFNLTSSHILAASKDDYEVVKDDVEYLSPYQMALSDDDNSQLVKNREERASSVPRECQTEPSLMLSQMESPFALQRRTARTAIILEDDDEDDDTRRKSLSGAQSNCDSLADIQDEWFQDNDIFPPSPVTEEPDLCREILTNSKNISGRTKNSSSTSASDFTFCDDDFAKEGTLHRSAIDSYNEVFQYSTATNGPNIEHLGFVTLTSVAQVAKMSLSYE